MIIPTDIKKKTNINICCGSLLTDTVTLRNFLLYISLKVYFMWNKSLRKLSLIVIFTYDGE